MAKLAMKASAFQLLKNDNQGGDAHFVCQDKHTIGVADGAGQSDKGKYAQELMCNCSIALLGQYEGAVDPKRVLKTAYENTKTEGACTSCLASIRGNWLHYVSMGDSRLMLFRDQQVMHKSPVQQRVFDEAYQLGRKNDHPNFAHGDKILIQSGDIIVVGTDGFFDNVYSSEISEILSQEQGKSTEDLARKLAELAKSHSLDDKYHSPFARAAALAEESHTGGRDDDINVVVGMINSV